MNFAHGMTTSSEAQIVMNQSESYISKITNEVSKITKTNLDGCTTFQNMMAREYRVGAPLKSIIWGDIRRQHREWFICLHPNRITQKKWVLKNEYIEHFKSELEEYIKREGR